MHYFYLLGFMACVPAANWLIGNVGTACIPNGPCLVPVGFGLDAPSGVLLIGIALVLRDMVHERFGSVVSVGAIVAGAVLSAMIAPPALVIASATAFLLSEMSDLAVYSPLRRKQIIMAVVASGVAGAAVDSAVFLYLAFGSLDHLSGQIVGKMWASIAAVPIIMAMRAKRATA